MVHNNKKRKLLYDQFRKIDCKLLKQNPSVILGLSLLQTKRAFCEEKTASSNDVPSQLQALLMPIAGQVSYGLLLGGCAGFTVILLLFLFLL